MDKLPWMIQREIIDIAVSLEPKYCLLNKEWFLYAAGRMMVITSDMLRKDSQPSIWIKKAEKIQLSDFSKVSWDILNDCQNIKKIDFDFKEGDVVFPVHLLTILNKSPLESARISLGSKDRMEQLCFLFEGICSQLKYLNLVFESNNKLAKLFEISFQNIIFFEAGYVTENISFSQINKSMPNLEILSIHANEVNFCQSLREITFFKKLKSLDLKVKFRFPISGDGKINDLTLFYFPILKTFKLQYISDDINLNRLPQCMPKLQILHLDLISHKVLSMGFPILAFSCLKELNLKFFKRADGPLVFNLDNFPSLLGVEINDDFELCASELNISSKINKLDLTWSKSFPYPAISNQLHNLNLLIIDCGMLENIYDVFKLCDRVAELDLRNIKDSIVAERLPKGPFKTTCLKMSGEHFLNDNLIDWFGSEFQLIHLNLENGGYLRLFLDLTKFPKLKHFYLS